MIKMKKSDVAIAYTVVALILGSVLVGLAGCQMGMMDGLDLGGTPSSGVDTGPIGGLGGYGGGGGKTPSLKISWNGDSTNHDGATLEDWKSIPLGLTAGIANAPAGAQVRWTIDSPAGVVEFDGYTAGDLVSPGEAVKLKPGVKFGNDTAAVTVTAALAGTGVTASFTIARGHLVPVITVDGGLIGGTTAGWSNASVVMEWQRADQSEITAKLGAAKVQWDAYAEKVDPQPKDLQGPSSFISGKLDNSQPGDNGSIVIHRYWPSAAAGLPANWKQYSDKEGVRKTEWIKAVTEIRAMVAAIEASPPYPNGSGDLTELHTLMELAIPDGTSPAPTGQQQTTWDTSSDKIVIPASEGFLYQYYLGYIPEAADYIDNPPMNGELYLEGTRP